MKTQYSKTNAPQGLTLVELLIVIAVVFILLGLLVPPPMHAKAKAQRANCQNNLKQIGLAFRTWEGDYGNRYPMSISTNAGGSMEYLAGPGLFHHLAVMSNEINNTKIVVCPADNRSPATGFNTMNNSNLSYFVGLDADERFPSFILSGDRNLVTNGVAVDSGLANISSTTPITWSSKIHNQAGDIGLADGSVQQTASANLPMYFQSTGTNLNRLAVP